ncbi:MAG: hypothetical protein LIP05_08455 [Tannerellaceae bacterium]|nr:hypothetical protein [Tannerellaceae bacterium]
MALNIYTQSGVLKATVSPSDNSTHQTAIMSENVLNLSFTLPEYLPLEVNDYTLFEGEKFELLEYYQPVKKSSIEYDYSPKFYGIIARLKNALVLNLTDGANESSFSLTADASAHLQFVLDNINRITGSKVWSNGEIKATGNKTIVYDCISCFDALNKIAEEFEVEWWIEGTTIHLSRCEHGDPIEFGYRKGLLSITKSDNENAKFFTRLYPIGSSRNIDKKKYGYSRLRLSNGVQYMEHNTHLGIVEFSEEAAFSHIYPRRIGKVRTVRTEEKTGEDGEPFTIFYFTDPQMPFDPNEYEIEGVVKSLVFQSGELNGYDFEVNYNSQTKEFEIITQFPTEDSQLPDHVLCPAPTDEYILYNINMPESYYTDAEYELKGAVEEYIQKYSVDVSVYKSPTDYIYFSKNNIDLRLGRRIRLLSDEYFTGGNHDTRVTSITRKINNPLSMDIECSYSVAAGRISQIESNVVDIQTQFKEQLSKTALQVLKSWDSVDPSEYNVLSSVRTLRAISNSLKKLAEESDLKYLRKDIADSAKELISFLDGIDVIGEALIDRLVVDNGAMFRDILSSEEFISGFPAGKGWAILWKEVLNAAGMKERKAVMELDEVTVRGVMRIYEMIISQQRGENGTRLTSDQMHVHSIDPEQRKIYLDTEKGVLYNPFRAGDILMVQQYQGLPTAENGYSVTKQYELAVVDAGIGSLSDKEERLDWITYKSFVGDISSVAARDVLTRVDSLTNFDRKGIIKQTSVEEGAPYLDVIYGMKTDPDNAVRTRLGRLSGIVNYWWGQLQGYGLYSENAYLLGDFRLRTGDNVQTLFEMVEGMLRSAMQTMTYTLTEEDNFLTNAAFTRDMECWIHDSNIVFFEADGELINTGNNFMTEKTRSLRSWSLTDGKCSAYSTRK